MKNTPKRSNHYILFIDDEEKTVKNFKKFFENEFNVIATTNHEEILDQINKKAVKIAVIISDQRMPKISGVDLLKTIKEKNPNIIRILSTAYADLQDNIRAINDSNIFGYLSKPWNLDEVRNLILKALKEFDSHQYYISLGGSIAHEMRNPLNRMRQSALFAKEKLVLANQKTNENTTLLSHEDFTQIVDCLDIADVSAKRGNAIIDIILNSITQKPINADNFQPMSVAKILEIFIKEYSFREGEKQRVIIDVKPSENFTFLADENLILYIFFNLLKNSLYYTKSCPNLKITISAKMGQNFNQISFLDNGPGIDEEKLKNLFEAFSTSGKVGGTGLGLVFCKRAMYGFNGDISCNSKKDEFCEFILSFPTNFKVKNKIEGKNKSFDTSQGLLKDKRILIVDDEDVNVLVTTKFFEKYQVKIDKAFGGMDAIKMATEKNYDLILMDIEMPEINGLKAAQKIKALNKNIPIIAVTGNNSEEKLKEILDAGFDNYFIKGDDYADLVKIIADCLLVFE